MSQTIDEQLSALLDGELPVAEEALLLRRLAQNRELRGRMGRYALISDLLTDATVHPGALQLGERVRAALDAPEFDGEVLGATRAAAGGRAIASGLVGAGLAATIALVVALNLTPAGDGAQRSQLATGITDIANVARVAVAADDPRHEHRATIAPARLQRYMVSHAEFSNIASRQFLDAHLVMPTFGGAVWRPTETVE